MSLYVREIDWMWNDLHLSLAECRVYAYIYGLTHGAKGGYNGSKRHLAELLGVSTSATKTILDALMEKNLVVYADGIWKSVRSENGSVHSENESVLSENSPQTPLYNNINNKKQADMQTLFEKFFKKFAHEFRNRYAVTNLNFGNRTEAAQLAMWDAVKDEPDGSVDKNPYFFVQDFPDPKPVFLRGDEPGDLVQVKYGDRIKICTRATMELFGLEWYADWNS